jgi:hypothetical protein
VRILRIFSVIFGGWEGGLFGVELGDFFKKVKCHYRSGNSAKESLVLDCPLFRSPGNLETPREDNFLICLELESDSSISPRGRFRLRDRL